jgi:hypothetical protein
VANSKISALTSATTPLAGTEVLPIVQSSATTKVTVANLTAGRAVSASSLALTTALPATSGGTGSTNAFTSNGMVYASSTTILSTGSAITFDGTNFATTGSATATRFIPSGSTVPTDGLYLPAASTVGISTNSTERIRIRSDGNVGIGNNGNDLGKISIGGTLTTSSSNSQVIRSTPTIPSTTTNNYRTFLSAPITEATAFTLTTLNHFSADPQTFGAGSAVTNQRGFSVESTLTGATNNYGFYGNIASAANRFNFYANGTAQNAFSGDVLIFGAGGLGYTTGSGGTVTQGTSRTTGVTLNKTNGAITLFSAAGLATFQSFTVTNSTVAATDVVHVTQKSGTDLYQIFVTATAAGSFRITYATTGGVTIEQPVFNFAVIKAVAA